MTYRRIKQLADAGGCFNDGIYVVEEMRSRKRKISVSSNKSASADVIKSGFLEKSISIRDARKWKRVRREVIALKQLSSQPNINKMQDHFLPKGGGCSIILEYCDRGSLESIKKEFVPFR